MSSIFDTVLEAGVKAANALIVNPNANVSGIVQQAGAKIVSGIVPSASGVYETGVLTTYVTGRLQELNADAREVRDKRNQAQSLGQKSYAAAFDAWLTKDFPAAVQALADLSTRFPALMLDPAALNEYKEAAIRKADYAHGNAARLLASFSGLVKTLAGQAAGQALKTSAGVLLPGGSYPWGTAVERGGQIVTRAGKKVEEAAGKVKEFASSPTGALLLTGAVGLAAFYLLAPALGQFAGGYVTARRAR